MGGKDRKFLVAMALLVLALPTAVSAMPGVAAPRTSWAAPTPLEGKRFATPVGRELVFALTATAPGAPVVNVSITAAGLPARAGFAPVTANPGTATVNWRPTRAQAGGTFDITFTAQPSAPGVAPATRHVRLHVPKPKPKRKPKSRRKSFVLSSEKKELYRYAFVIRSAVVRSAPRRTAAAVAKLGRWTPEGTTNLVLTLEGRRTPRGVWIKVRLPILPANRSGWVRRKALSDWKEIGTRLVVDRRRLTATLYRRGKVVFRAPVGVGVSHWPTPRGEFFIRNQLYGFGNPVYGPIAFGTSARSAVLTDWPGGGFIGIHGTNQPSIIPGRVSHGCIRMKNGHILRLAKLMPVGSPLTVL
jgi:lipoprotein-anchoring transpeptidase ErfK/SrfK